MIDQTRYEYLKNYQSEETLLRDSYLVVRIDGRAFTPFCQRHPILRPIDDRLLGLMNECGRKVMEKNADIVFGFGQSDEFSFIFKKSSETFGRKRDTILTFMVSTFTASFVLLWDKYFPGVKLEYPPSFDARAVLYSHFRVIRDYLSWRQADSYINCMYNYTLCALMRTGLDGPTATLQLNGTLSSQKLEILSKHGIDFAALPLSHKQGITLIRIGDSEIIESTEDMIPDAFWEKYTKLLK